MAERSTSPRGRTSAKSAGAPEEKKAREPAARRDGERHGLTLDLPMLSINVHPPRISRQQVGDVVGTAVNNARAMLRPKRIVYYGGLAALAAFEMIEWPVAAAIGVGTIVVESAREQRKAPAAASA